MAGTERVTIRLPTDSITLMQSLVDSEEYDNLSDVFRAAVECFLSMKFSPENIEKILVDLPKGNVLELESLIEDGDSVSLDDAIRNAVREYTRNRINQE